MDFIIVASLIVLILLSILVGIVYLGYWIPKKMGHPKWGVVISRSIALLIILGGLCIVFNDKFYSKSDAKTNLKSLHIELHDDFEILLNESGGLRDYYHRFKLKISEEDRLRLINEIKSNKNYTSEIKEGYELHKMAFRNRYSGDTLRINYQTKNMYKTELYHPNGLGYKPTYKIVSLSKVKNELTFEFISD